MSLPETDQKSLADDNMSNEGYRSNTNQTNEMIELFSYWKNGQQVDVENNVANVSAETDDSKSLTMRDVNSKGCWEYLDKMVENNGINFNESWETLGKLADDNGSDDIDHTNGSTVVPFDKSKTCLFGKRTAEYATRHKVYAEEFKDLYKNGTLGQTVKEIRQQRKDIIQWIVRQCKSEGYQFRFLKSGEAEANAVLIGNDHREMRKGFQRIFARND